MDNKLTVENVAQLDAGPHLQRKMTSTTTTLTTRGSISNEVSALRKMSRIEVPNISGGRRLSTFSRGSISMPRGSISFRQGSLKQEQYVSHIPQENTYKLGPEPEETFNAAKIKTMVEGILENYLQGEEYDAAMCSHLSQSLSEMIKTRLKEMNMPRYKIVCIVTIGQVNQQGLKVTSRCLWDTNTDNFACATYSNSSLFAIATIYGTYFE